MFTVLMSELIERVDLLVEKVVVEESEGDDQQSDEGLQRRDAEVEGELGGVCQCYTV